MNLAEALATLTRGHAGIVVRSLDGRTLAEVEPDRAFTAASLIKLPILAAALDAGLPSRLRLPVNPPVAGSGVLAHLTDVSDLTVRDLLTLMIVVSDNTATNTIIDRLGMEEVNAWCERHGLADTDLARTMMDVRARERGVENTTSAADVALTLTHLATSPFALEILHAQQVNDRLPRHLPRGYRIAHKTGELRDALHDAGIVFPPTGPPIVIAVLTDAAEGPDLIADCGRLIYGVLAHR